MVKSGNKERRTPKIVDQVIDSSDDEEIDEDLAFNSEDERKYGALFAPSNKNSSKKRRKKSMDDNASSSSDGESSDDESSSDNGDDDDDDDGIASDDDASEGDGGQYMLDLLNNLDRKTDDKEKDRHADARAAAVHYSTNTLSESEFPSSAGGGSSDGGGGALTMDQLMGGIANTQGYASLQKSLSSIHPISTATSSTAAAATSARLSTTTAPLPKLITQRTERKIHYAETSEDVTQWTEAVRENRRAETLDFRPQGRIKINRDGLVGKFKVETDFEKEMAQVLEGSGAGGEEAMIKAEERKLLGDDDPNEEDGDDLGEKLLCMEEYKRRRGELAKMRALLFYEEQKRHHINKIKSKKYRKIRKKKRVRNEEAEDADAMEEDGALAREMEEKAEMDRMKERISLKHKNTSKWAKRVLRRGGAIDGETRKALSEQIRIGDDLRKKMLGTRDDDDDDDDEKMDLLEEAKLILADTEKDDDEEKKGIFNLAFMKRGMESQRKRAKEEARELLRELQANETDEEEDSDTNADILAKEEVNKNKKKKKKKAASEKEIGTILDDGKLVAKSLEFGNSTGVSVSGSLTIDGGPLVNTSHEDGNYTTNISLSNVNSNTTDDTVSKSSDGATAAVPIVTEVQKDATTTSSNPWLRTTSDDDDDEDNDNDGNSTEENKAVTKAVRKTKMTLPAVSKRGVVNIAGAVNIVSGEDESSNENSAIMSSKEEETTTATKENANSESKIATLSQAELFRRAFAAPEEEDVEREFEVEKDAMRDRDDHLKRKIADENKVLPGWGSWAGDGAPPPRPSKRRLPKKMLSPEPKPKKRLREDDRKKNVIISAKRMKKMAKFQVGDIPHPFSSREQYEEAMSGAVGREWNVSGAVKDMTRASVITRAGKMIRPMSKKVKAKRAPAKF